MVEAVDGDADLGTSLVDQQLMLRLLGILHQSVFVPIRIGCRCHFAFTQNSNWMHANTRFVHFTFRYDHFTFGTTTSRSVRPVAERFLAMSGGSLYRQSGDRLLLRRYRPYRRRTAKVRSSSGSYCARLAEAEPNRINGFPIVSGDQGLGQAGLRLSPAS